MSDPLDDVAELRRAADAIYAIARLHRYMTPAQKLRAAERLRDLADIIDRGKICRPSSTRTVIIMRRGDRPLVIR